MSYYQYHVFFCINQREEGHLCCEQSNASEIRAYAKVKIKKLGLSGKAKVRINSAGCLNRCEQGPVLVIYPEEIWYHYLDRQDIDEIIEQHLQQGKIVKRLQLKQHNETSA